MKPYDVIPHMNSLNETVQMTGHNICFFAELTKIVLSYHQILPLIKSQNVFFFSNTGLHSPVGTAFAASVVVVHTY